MGLRNKNLVINDFYHLYNRGNNKNEIFLDDQDYDHFIKLLYICNSERSFKFRNDIVGSKIDAFDFKRGTPLVSVLAWVLMPNHFHIMIISHRSDLCVNGYNPITEFMRKVSTSYAMYFNKKYKRTGSLFEGKFKSKGVDKENYFNYIFAYIHLNPIKLIQKDWKESGINDKTRARNFLVSYRYSSFNDYFGEPRREISVIDKKNIPEYIKNAHVKEIFEWIELGKN